VSDTEVLVCVGGEADGRRLTVDPGSKWIRVPSAKSNVPPRWAGGPPPSTIDLAYTIYVRHPWRSGDLTRYVLVPEGQAPETTLALLLDAYGK
jgi:hypothetical protein